MTTAGALQLEAAFLYTAVLHYPGFLDYKTDIAAWISFFDFSIVLYMNHRNRGFDDDPVCVSIAVRLLWQAMNFPEFAPRNFIVGVTRGQDVIFDEATSGNLVPVRSRLSKLRNVPLVKLEYRLLTTGNRPFENDPKVSDQVLKLYTATDIDDVNRTHWMFMGYLARKGGKLVRVHNPVHQHLMDHDYIASTLMKLYERYDIYAYFRDPRKLFYIGYGDENIEKIINALMTIYVPSYDYASITAPKAMTSDYLYKELVRRKYGHQEFKPKANPKLLFTSQAPPLW